MSGPTTPSSLHALFVFNPELGEEATEARKLLYFYDNRPDTVHRVQSGERDYVDLNYQKDLCGIAEGLIAFTRDFSPDSLCESVHCEQHRYAFAQPEKDYWIVLVVKNPTLITKDAKKEGAGTLHTEYLEDELEDSVLQAILHRCYSLFSLFNSSFTSIVSSSSHDALRCKLGLFMTYFLPTIRFSQLIYFTDIHGFQFLPVDKITFLTIQYIIHLLTLNFHPPGSSGGGGGGGSGGNGTGSLHAATGGGVIKNCALMYNSKLIYSGLSSEMMFLLYSLDQDLMYFFLVDYLTLKENLHLDIQRYVAAQADRERVRAAAEAAGGASETPKPRPWATRRPEPIAGIYNVPESVYERNGRVATNRKAWDRAQNKGEVGAEEEFPEEPEEEEQAHGLQPPSMQRLASGALADDEDREKHGGGGRSRGNSRSGSNASAASAPFGYMTGPYRVSNVASGAGAAGAAGTSASAGATTAAASASAALPGVHVSHFAPCINSPLIYLDGIDSLQTPSTGSVSGPSAADSNNPAFAPFPNAADPSQPAKPMRLVVYQKYKITLFLIVEDQEEPANKSATAAGAAGEASSAADAAASQLAGLSLSSSDAATASSARPPLSFYSSLESFMESNLKKLGEMLYEQSVRLQGGAGGGGSGGSGGSGSAVVEEPYRFLYFNHMNLALKTSLSSAAPGGKSGAAGSVLTMETIRIIRDLHRDFNTPAFKRKSVAAQSSAAGAARSPAPKHLQHSITHEGCTEVCVKTRSHGWVIGRRATQSHREFFLLLEDKIASLAEIQEEVENLSRTYFYNIFIH